MTSGVLDAVRVLAIANQKGGVGKTTTVINLAAYLGALEFKVLVVDCDPQSNATRSITPATPVEDSLYQVLMEGAAAEPAIVSTTTPNVDLLASSPELAGAEIELAGMHDRESVLARNLKGIVGSYDFTLIDCPPSLGLLTINALVAAEGLIIPVQCEYLALEGVAHLMDTIRRVRSGLNPRLRVFGLLMTMYDRRTSLSEEVVAEVRSHYPDLTFETLIPRNVRLGEAPSFGQPILDYDPGSSGAQAYASFAREVMARG